MTCLVAEESIIRKRGKETMAFCFLILAKMNNPHLCRKNFHIYSKMAHTCRFSVTSVTQPDEENKKQLSAKIILYSTGETTDEF